MLNQQITDHYEQGDLIARIEAGINAAGKTTVDVTIDDLAAVDEFHTGGRQATKAVLSNLDLKAGERVLDVGSGLGGAARYCATEFGCTVLGVDLTSEFVDAARVLTGWVGLGDQVSFECASAQNLPAAEPFDAAYLMHVGMNVADKAELFAGIADRLRPGGRLAIYDLMRIGEGELLFPVPWASSAETSFVEPQATYETALVHAGFQVQSATDHSEIAAAFVEAFEKGMAGDNGPPPVGLHLVMGATTPQKAVNSIAAMNQGLITPVELIATI